MSSASTFYSVFCFEGFRNQRFFWGKSTLLFFCSNLRCFFFWWQIVSFDGEDAKTNKLGETRHGFCSAYVVKKFAVCNHKGHASSLHSTIAREEAFLRDQCSRCTNTFLKVAHSLCTMNKMYIVKAHVFLREIAPSLVNSIPAASIFAQYISHYLNSTQPTKKELSSLFMKKKKFFLTTLLFLVKWDTLSEKKFV